MVYLNYNEQWIGVSRIKNKWYDEVNGFAKIYRHNYRMARYSDTRLAKIKSALKHMNHTQRSHIIEDGVHKERYMYGYPEGYVL